MTIHTVGHIWRDKMTVREILDGYHNPGNDKAYLERNLNAIAEIINNMPIKEVALSNKMPVQVVWGNAYRQAKQDITTLIRGQKL